MRNLMGSEEHEHEDDQAGAPDGDLVEDEAGEDEGEELSVSPVSLPGSGLAGNGPSVLPQPHFGSSEKGHSGNRSIVEKKRVAFYAGLDPFTHIPLWSVDGELVSKSNIPPGYEIEPQSKRYVFRG